MIVVQAAPKARSVALLLRGGAFEPHIAAFVSVSTNTLALVLFTAMAQWVREWRMRVAPNRPLTKLQELGATIICGYIAYYLTYLLAGFVPMGYVVGARPWLPGAETFAPQR